VSHVAPPRHGNAGLRALDLRNLPMVLVLALGTTGIAYSAAVPRHWLRGVLLLAVACGIAGVLRLLLPVRQAGLLAVRGRLTDVVCYLGLAVAIIVLGLALPA
jgi:predicted membrane channel-forming protein YqfA (hemolysin III family)